MAGTIWDEFLLMAALFRVSMESGLDGRNNRVPRSILPPVEGVSMESGLDGRNNVWGGEGP